MCPWSRLIACQLQQDRAEETQPQISSRSDAAEMDGIRVPSSIEHESLNEIVGGDSDPIPLIDKKKPAPRAGRLFRPRTVQCIVWRICSMRSMAGTASRLASPVPLENQHRSPATSSHSTRTRPCRVTTTAQAGRSWRSKCRLRMCGQRPPLTASAPGGRDRCPRGRTSRRRWPACPCCPSR